MPLIRCPHCGKAMQAPAQVAGRKIACPHCTRPFAVTAAAVPTPAASAPAPKVPRWYFAKNRQRQGPVGWKDLKALVARGELTAADPILVEGETTWKTARDVPGLFAPFAGTVSVAPSRPDRRRLYLAAGGALGALVLLIAIIAWPRGPVKDTTDPLQWAPEDKFVAPAPAPAVRPDPRVPVAVSKARPPRTDPYDLAGVTGQEHVEQLVTRLNDYRKTAGLVAVTIDTQLSDGCQAHASYVARNRDHPRLAGGGVQDEDPTLAGFREEGKQAARNSLLALAEPARAIDIWFGRLMSRLPLLDPDLRRIGFGTALNDRGDWVSVLDAVRGRGPDPIPYPAPGQTDVPLSFSGGTEHDADAGFPVSLQFPAGKKVTDAEAVLSDANGNRIPVIASTPEQPLPGVRHSGLVGLLPRQALLSQTRYRARVTAKVDGQALEKVWEFATEDDSDAGGQWAARVLERLNQVRRVAGQDPVELDTGLSAACRSHARYLVLNARHAATQGLGAHDEDEKLPGFTREGKKAGAAAVIALGDYEPLDAVDGWIATLYHRVPLLDPRLRRIGFGCARGARLGWITVLDVATGQAKMARTAPVIYPADGQEAVPLTFPPGGEDPDPIPDDRTGLAGFPVTAFFPYQTPLLQARAKLEDEKGKAVPCWFSSPEQPANPKYEKHQGTTVCLIPREPLAPAHIYRVSMSGQMAGVAWSRSWRFKTAPAGLAADEIARRFLDRFNAARKQAGLGTVALEADLSKGCLAHAEYLARNAAQRGTKDFVVNDEKPDLPGYSKIGQQAARRSQVLFHAPRPEAHIGDLLGTLSRRGPLLEPRLARIGVGSALEVGRGWVNVVDLASGHEDQPPVVFPVDGQEKVPCAGGDRLPNEPSRQAGFPITVRFPSRHVIRFARGSLADAAGVTIDVWLSSPEQPFIADAPVNALSLHPARPLRPGQIYVVSLQAEVDGREWRRRWRFSTAPDDAP